MQLKPIDIVDLRITRRQARSLFHAAGYRLQTLARAVDQDYEKHDDLRLIWGRLEGSTGELQPHEYAFQDLYAAMANLEVLLYPDEEDED